MSNDGTRRPIKALRITASLDEDQGFGIPELLSRLAQELQPSVLTLNGLGQGRSRVFSLWEQVYLSQEAKDFLMTALHRDMVTADELEQALAMLFAQTEGFADLEDVRILLESVVGDPERQTMLALFDSQYVQ